MSTRLDSSSDLHERLSRQLLSTVRTTLESMLLVEYRLANVASLVGRFETRHLARAAGELESAAERLAASEDRRQAEVAALAAAAGLPEHASFGETIVMAHPSVREALARTRTSIIAARARIEVLEERARDVLASRIRAGAEVRTATTVVDRPHDGPRLGPGETEARTTEGENVDPSAAQQSYQALASTINDTATTLEAILMAMK